MDSEDEVEEGAGEEEDTEGDRPDDEGDSKWGWVQCVDAVSDTCRCSWDAVWEMGIIEFFNILCYRKDKQEQEKRSLEKWRKTH
jgi:hypothetical protein